MLSPMTTEGVRLRTGRGRWIVVAMALGSGMIFLDTTVVNVALPRIQSDLAAPLAGLQWVVNAYTLTLASFLLVGGDLGDTLGRKRIFVAGLIVFTLASVGCGIAPTLQVLIAGRALQGIGGALLVPGSLAVIQDVMAPEDRSRAIGIWAGLSGVTSAAGPLVGGYLVGAVSWRAVFFLNVPLFLLTVYAVLWHVPGGRPQAASSALDWLGTLCTAVGLAGLTYGLIEGPALGWNDTSVLSTLGLGAAGLLLFPLWEMRAPRPMVPLTIFRSRNFTGANLVSLAVYFAFGGALLFLTLDLQQVRGYSPLAAGAAILPITLLLLLLSPRMGSLTTRFGARAFMTAGPVINALGLLWFLSTDRTSAYLTGFFPGIILLGLGMSVFVTPLTTTVMSALPGNLSGIASGVNNAATRLASLLAIAILGVIIAARFDATLPGKLTQTTLSGPVRRSLIAREGRLAADPIPAALSPAERAQARAAVEDSFVDGFHWVAGTCALLCLAAGVVSWMTIRTESS